MIVSSILKGANIIPEYTGWDEGLYESLTSSWKKAYRIAAKLHNGVKRKDGSWYLKHINRSLRFFHSHPELFGTKFDINTIEKNICLHDCAEDHDNGAEEIERNYGDDALCKILWMSEPNSRVRRGLPLLVGNFSEEKKEKYQPFLDIIALIEKGDPYDTTVSSLKEVLPKGNWISLWWIFEERYNQEWDETKKKDIFADWIFQWMIQNMPEECFLAKSCERIDNLSDTPWLMNEKGGRSYEKTLATTSSTYLPRLVEGWWYKLHKTMRLEAGRWILKVYSFLPRISAIMTNATVPPNAPISQMPS